MIKQLLVLTFLLGFLFLHSQGPAWQWANEASSANSEQGSDVAVHDASGNLYIGGYFEGGLNSVYGSTFATTVGGRDAFIAKYSTGGALVWAIRIGSSNDDEIKSIATSSAGDVYVTGYFRGTADFDPGSGIFNLTSASSGQRDGFLAKYSSAGSFLWAVKFGNNGNDEGNAVHADTNGVYITGSYETSAAFYSTGSGSLTTTASQAGTNVFGAKYNSSGVPQWVISGGSTGNDIGTKVTADATNVFFTGTYSQNFLVYNSISVLSASVPIQVPGKPDMFVLSVTQTGLLSWATNASNADDVTATGIAVDAGKVYVSGSFDNATINFPGQSPLFTRPSPVDNEMFLAAITKSTGVYQWVTSQVGSHTGELTAYDLALDAGGNLLVSGSFKGTWYPGPNSATITSSGNEDIFLISFSPTGSFNWATRAGSGNVDIGRAVATSTTNSNYITGEHFNGAIFGNITLTNSGSKNLYVAKTCADIISNNIISASQTLCMNGTPIPFTGTLPTGAGGTYTYTWQQSTNGSSWTNAPGVNTGSVYAPGTLTTTTYFRRNVSAITSCIYSSNIVTITTHPTTSTAGSNQTVCATTATITGNTPLSGLAFWSLVSGGGAISNFSSAITQVSLGVGENIFSWNIWYLSCPISSSSVSITRHDFPTAASAGSNQAVCSTSIVLNANMPTVGVGTWSVIAGTASVTAPQNATSNATNLSVGNNRFVWGIANGVCPVSLDTVDYFRDDFPTLASAGQDMTLCATSATLGAAMPTVGTPSWSVLSGSAAISSSSFSAPVVSSLTPGANLFAWKVGNGVCPLVADTVVIFRYAVPTTATITGGNPNICASTLNLSGNVPTVGSGLWTTTSAAVINTPTNAFSSVNNLPGGQSQFVWTISNGNCTPSTATFVVQRDLAPGTPSAGINSTVCATSVVLAGNTPTAGTGIWSVAAGTSSVSAPFSATTSAGGLSAGLNSFVLTFSNGVCPTSSSTVNVHRDLPPTTATVMSNTSTCGTNFSITGSVPSVGTGSWTTSVPGVTIGFPNNNLTNVLNLATGPNVFVWTISNGTCTSSSASLTITRIALPSAAITGSNQVVCASTATLSGNTPTVGSGMWTTTGNAVITTPTNPISPVTNLSAGINTFTWTISNGICNPSSTVMTIQRDLPPGTATVTGNQPVCSSSIVLSGTTPTVGQGVWSVVSGNASLSSVSNPTTTANNLSAGNNGFVWTLSNGVCAASAATVFIQRDLSPGTASVLSGTTICSTTTTINAIQPSQGSGVWTTTSQATIMQPGSSVSTVTNLAVGSNVFVWTISNGVCPTSTASVVVVRDNVPTPATVANNQTVCSAATTLSGNSPTVGTGLWTTSSSAVITTPTNPVSPVNSLPAGQNNFVWTISNGVCAPSSITLSIQRDLSPTTASAGISQTICQTSATLTANTPSVGQGIWSVLTGTSAITSPLNPTTGITNVNTGPNNYVWTISNGVCSPSSSTVTVVRDDFPSAAVVSNSQAICATSLAISATPPVTGTGSWSVISGGGLISNSLSATTTITSLGVGNNILLWKVANGSCSPNTATLIVQRDQNPGISNAGSSQTICATTLTLSGNTPSVGTGNWSVQNGSATITNPVSGNTSITGIGVGVNVLQWTISNGVCSPSSSTVSIQRDDFPSLAQATANQTICGLSTSLTAIQPVTGSGAWTLISGTATIQNPSTPTTEVTGLAEGLNKFNWSVSNGVCPVSTDSLTVLATIPPSIAQAGADQRVCSTSATLNAVNPVSGNGSWLVNSGTGVITNSTAGNAIVSTLSEDFNSFIWVVKKANCPDNSDTVTVRRDLSPGIANAGNDQHICGSSTTLAANFPIKGAGRWQEIENINFTNSASPTTPVYGLKQGSNKLIWQLENGVCPVSSDTVKILADLKPSKAVAGNDISVCSQTVLLTATAPAVGKGYWSYVSGARSSADTLNANLLLEKLTIGKHNWNWVVYNGICPVEKDEIIITRDSLLKADAGEDQTIETGVTNLKADLPFSGAGLWTITEGSANLGNASDPESNVTGLAPGDNRFKWTVKSGGCPETSDEVLVYVKPFSIPNAFSPNNDGFNDVFEITSLQYFKAIKLSVFNRWGALVYNQDDYQNTWAGTNLKGEKLVDDTYYYVIEVEGYKNFSGFVMIKSHK